VEKYPRAAIAMGNGELVQVTNFTVSANNNAKLKATLRRRNAGVVYGNFDGSIKFSMEFGETGPERDYVDLVLKGTVKQVRVKLPGGLTLVCEGVYQSFDIDQPLDDASKIDLTFICGIKKAS
jgi:hypothetical protein